LLGRKQKVHYVIAYNGWPVSKLAKGRGFGEWLLIDALTKLLAATDSVAFPVVLVDAK
jgi:hypothetical protein